MNEQQWIEERLFHYHDSVMDQKLDELDQQGEKDLVLRLRASIPVAKELEAKNIESERILKRGPDPDPEFEPEPLAEDQFDPYVPTHWDGPAAENTDEDTATADQQDDDAVQDPGSYASHVEFGSDYDSDYDSAEYEGDWQYEDDEW
jgi:hypothetical protein